MFKKEQKLCVVCIDDSDTNIAVSFLHVSTSSSTSNEQACTSRHPTSREQASLQHPEQAALQPTLAKEEHADRCAESTWHGSEWLIYANLMSSFENNSDTEMQHDETYTQREAPEETVSASGGTQEISRGKMIEVIQELQKNVGMSTNRINVQRKTVLADYLNTRKRRPWFKPEVHIKVVFVGETAIDDGGPKREFFTDALEQLKLRIFHSNGLPVESTVALTEETFKLGAELIVMSIVQGGPAPTCMSPVIYDIVSRGFKSQTCVLLDMIKNGNFKTIANKIDKVSTVEQLHSILVEDDVLDVLSQVGYRGVPSRETLECKESLVR
ncbi:G2 M phase-specific E3 ubiquitin- ligase-like [Paramuricea clavata]|uniref:G2 M phase-specific E3 ubiquitin- ligase-like n=1 Tax=Paramuricea clavata TaxID=317549 RepID=A0A7D9E604_PARCT|nr:G2 M phase-specific E3 ubiquitin- ligase-like [Paramuricea clavata]